MNQITRYAPLRVLLPNPNALPKLITDAGERATMRFLEFFAASISNPGTRAVYANAVKRFCTWCESNQLRLHDVTPLAVAGYISCLKAQLSDPTIKLHLAAVRMMFDYLVTGHVLTINPASSVRGPKHVVKKGKTPVLDSSEARQLFDSIDISSIIGLRDRAIIGVMVFSFARVSAVLGMDVEDFYQQGRKMWFRLHEKGGKFHECPAHHKAIEYLDAYLEATSRNDARKMPLFCTVSQNGTLTDKRLKRLDAWRMVKGRAESAGLSADICCHSFRATGITCYLENGGSLEHAQRIASHESPRTTMLYDRTGDIVSLDEIERIVI